MEPEIIWEKIVVGPREGEDEAFDSSEVP